MPINTSAQAYNILQECMALSTQDEDIHNCLDNYLDVMDDNISDLSQYIAGDLSDDSLDAFQRAQETFFSYRKENCTWYLTLAQPRERAQQIAKNCLAEMSQQRLSELQALIADRTSTSQQLRGYYVYGASRNSFQPCGNEKRYWIEGENTAVGELQQTYLSKSTEANQLMYVSLAGTLATSSTYPDHAGIASITAVNDIRLPNESDCGLPISNLATVVREQADVAALPLPTITEDTLEPVIEEPTLIVNEPEQVMRAYFGEWFAECKQERDNFACDVSVAFAGDEVDSNDPPMLKLKRRANKRTIVQLEFPEREVDTPVKILWRVDGYTFGDVVGSDIRVDQDGTRQIVHERKFVNEDLMPLLVGGGELGVEILADVDDPSGDVFEATLNGLTRALAFADDFVNSGGSL